MRKRCHSSSSVIPSVELQVVGRVRENVVLVLTGLHDQANSKLLEAEILVDKSGNGEFEGI